jgi:hypothetical protein
VVIAFLLLLIETANRIVVAGRKQSESASIGLFSVGQRVRYLLTTYESKR